MNYIINQIIEKTKYIKEKFSIMYSGSEDYLITPKIASELNKVGIETEDFSKGKFIFSSDESDKNDPIYGEIDSFIINYSCEYYRIYFIRYYNNSNWR